MKARALDAFVGVCVLALISALTSATVAAQTSAKDSGAKLLPLGFSPPSPCDASLCQPVIEILRNRANNFASIRTTATHDTFWNVRVSPQGSANSWVAINPDLADASYYVSTQAHHLDLERAHAAYVDLVDRVSAILPTSFRQPEEVVTDDRDLGEVIGSAKRRFKGPGYTVAVELENLIETSNQFVEDQEDSTLEWSVELVVTLRRGEAGATPSQSRCDGEESLGVIKGLVVDARSFDADANGITDVDERSILRRTGYLGPYLVLFDDEIGRAHPFYGVGSDSDTVLEIFEKNKRYIGSQVSVVGCLSNDRNWPSVMAKTIGVLPK